MFEKEITPSILNAAPEQRAAVIQTLLKLGIKWIHYDVMDGQFVANHAITVEEITTFYNRLPKHLCDAHLMVADPFAYARQLKDVVTCLTVHYEAFATPTAIHDFVNEFSPTNWIGIAINPTTPVTAIEPILHLFDLVLIMAVEPGRGGQPFIATTYDKIRSMRKFIDAERLPTLIQVDGGIKDFNSQQVFAAGANFNVVGSYLMDNLNQQALTKLK